jgi:hypothetical protein
MSADFQKQFLPLMSTDDADRKDKKTQRSERSDKFCQKATAEVGLKRNFPDSTNL